VRDGDKGASVLQCQWQALDAKQKVIIVLTGHLADISSYA
jgi:hypothetical protein